MFSLVSKNASRRVAHPSSHNLALPKPPPAMAPKTQAWPTAFPAASPQHRTRQCRPRARRSSAACALATILALVLALALAPAHVAGECDQGVVYASYNDDAAGKGAAEVRAYLHATVSADHTPKSYAQAYDLLEAIGVVASRRFTY